MCGPTSLPAKRTATCFRVALPPKASADTDRTANFSPSGRPGDLPYSCVSNNLINSRRRCSSQTSGVVTFRPLASTRGSGSVYGGTWASS